MLSEISLIFKENTMKRDSCVPFPLKGLNEQLLGVWVNWMLQVNWNVISSSCFYAFPVSSP